jgi:transglutaminase-like putative cysteine protease
VTFGKLFLRLLDALVILGVLAYSVAEEDLIYAAIALPLVVVAALVTGGPSGKPLPRWIINAALLIATGHMGLSWYSNLGETIGILCRYVIWLQLIKMFEPRTPRDQSQVIILSMVLVIGACLTSVKADLGGVLLLYIPTLLATVLTFQVFAGQVGVGAAIAAGRRPGADLRRVLLSSGVLLMAVAIVVFIITPRGLGEAVVGAWRGPVPKQVIGFRDHVQLGAQGLLTESRHVVMEMRVESTQQTEPYTREVLLRGAVLDEYDPAKRIWRRSESLSLGRRHQLWKPDDVFIPADTTLPRLTQHIVAIEQPSELFAAWRPLWASFESAGRNVRYQRYDEAGLFDIRLTTWTGAYHYTIVSSPFATTPVREFEPRYADPPLGRRFARRRGSEQWYSIRAVPPTSLRPVSDAPPVNVFREGPIRELAERILAERGIDLSDGEAHVRELAAAAFRHYLQTNYTYTTLMVAPLADEDPIEMFLFDTGPEGRGGKGHCEYFSSAFAAMCLSVGIPARVVTGYAATEVDPVSGLYVIRQNHAHAWADVELAPGRWREFDPSPSADVQRLHQPPAGILATIRRAIDALQFAWIRSVVSFDRSSQVDALNTASGAPALAFGSVNDWIAKRLSNQPSEDGQESPTISAARVFASVLVVSTLLALIFFVLIARGGAIIRAFCRLLRVRPPRIIERLTDPGTRELGRLRRRMEDSLRRAGMPRAEATPSLAHAASLAARDETLSRAAGRLTRLYYQARFGGVPPDRSTLDEARALAREVRLRVRRRALTGQAPAP